jgi:tungstate transport system permease protein
MAGAGRERNGSSGVSGAETCRSSRFGRSTGIDRIRRYPERRDARPDAPSRPTRRAIRSWPSPRIRVIASVMDRCDFLHEADASGALLGRALTLAGSGCRRERVPDILSTIRAALGLLVGFDTTLLHIVALSLAVSLSASGAATLCGLPLGTALAVFRFRGRHLLILLANALLGLPPVVVGLALYLLLSRSGPLGTLGILFTPTAMVIAQFMLALPIVVALSHRAMVGIWRDYGDDLLVSGASRLRAIPHLLSIGRLEALTASLAGFGRSVSEVGAILIVGGNIAGYTRTMTTAIMLETSEGHLGFALALGLVLVVISIAVNACAFGIEARARRSIPREAA